MAIENQITGWKAPDEKANRDSDRNFGVVGDFVGGGGQGAVGGDTAMTLPWWMFQSRTLVEVVLLCAVWFGGRDLAYRSAIIPNPQLTAKEQHVRSLIDAEYIKQTRLANGRR